MDATSLLRPHLLDGRLIALGGGAPDALAAPMRELGATTAPLPDAPDEDAMAAAVDAATDVLLHDLRPAFAAGGGDALRVTLDLAWITARAVANAAFIPQERGGRIVLVAPAAEGIPSAGADPAAAGVRAAAENLARTLSIEWARHRITTVTIAPGAATTDAEIAALAAFLASPAGAYWSGCRLSLGEVAVSA